MTSRFVVADELGLFFGIMAADGRFVSFSDDEVIGRNRFFRTDENEKTENNEKRCKWFSGNFLKRDKKTEIEDITPVQRQAIIKYFVLCVRN